MVPVYLCEEVFSRVYPLFEDDEKNRFLMVEDVVDTEVNEDVELPLVVELIDVRRGLEGLLRLEYEDTVESDGDRHDNVGLVFGVLNCDQRDNSTQFSVETGKEGLERCEQVGKTN
ncbi:hypothetical protein RI543_004204 [Arxiozyma heterogenica]|uniref:Uncharacterized protein n=1 Tax=Arxiozyma heterogenica TaxID=278026 RepID=A0AAN7W0J4_9SACH|nr:hypothetical protein RI543_004204 [Kazachstania heterogenica]